MATTPHIGLTLVEQSQAQKEITVNQAFTRIDALLNSGAESRVQNTPPVSPADGDVYIVGASPTGAWAGKAYQITYFEQVWRFIVPNAGASLWVNDEGFAYSFDGTNWVMSGVGALLAAPALTPVLPTDYIPVMRGGQFYLATVSSCLAALSAGSGRLHFSTPGNSGYLGVL
jgi:hypothetical protein